MTYNRNELVKVQLIVYKPMQGYPGRYSDYFVAVVGPGVHLGNEDPNIAPRCSPVEHHFWTKQLWLPKEKEVYFKFLVVKASTNSVIDIEEIMPHRLHIGKKSLTVEMTYNKTAVIVKEDYDGLKALTTGERETFYSPSLDFKRPDHASPKPTHDVTSPELTTTEKTQHKIETLIAKNPIGVKTDEQLQLDKNQNCIKPETLQKENTTQAKQIGMMNQKVYTKSEVQEEEKQTNSQTNLETTNPSICDAEKREKIADPVIKPLMTSPILKVKEKMGNQVAKPNMQSSTICALQEEEQTLDPVTKPKMPLATLCALQEKEKMADPVKKAEMPSPNICAVQGKENLTDPLTKVKMPSSSIGAVLEQEKMTGTVTNHMMPSPTICTVQEREKLADPVTRPMMPRPTISAALEKEKMTKPKMPIPTISEVQEKEKITNPVTKPKMPSPAICTVQEKEKMTKPKMPILTICAWQEKEKMTNPVTKPKMPFPTIFAVQEKGKTTKPKVSSPSFCTFQKEEKMKESMENSKKPSSAKCIHPCTNQDKEDIVVTKSSEPIFNTGESDATISATIAKSLPVQNHELEVSSHLTESRNNARMVADDNKPERVQNIITEKGVNNDQFGHLPISKMGLMLVSAGVAIASYLGYRVLR